MSPSAKSCDDAARILELTLGDVVPDEDVGLEPGERIGMLEHLAACAACVALREELRETGEQLRAALVPDAMAQARADDDLVRLVHARLAAEPVAARPVLRMPLWRRPAFRAAAVLAVAVTGVAAWRAYDSGVLGSGVVVPPLDYPLTPPRVAGYAGPHFRDVTADSGIVQENHTGVALSKDWMIETTGHGAAVLDYDGDGDLDLFVPDGNRLGASERVADTWRLWRNDGRMRFTDVTSAAGLHGDAWGCASVAGDVNGDGRPDLFVACFGNDRLFLNRGDGTFEDATVRAGVAGLEEEWGTGAAMCDMDGDGDLDLYVANYADMRRFMTEAERGRGCTWRSMPVACGPTPLEPQQNRLFVNRGDGTFADATVERLPKSRRYSFQPVIADFDGDGAPDVFVATDAQAHLLLLNDGHGTFTDVAQRAGCAADGNGREQASMGVAAGDVDGDGKLDLYVTNFSHEPNCLYRNVGGLGRPQFIDATAPAHLKESGFMLLGWGATFFDYDADGDLDLAYANGHLYPDVQTNVPETSYMQHVALERNAGDGRFTEVSADAGAVIVPRAHRGLVVADFDDDGNMDMFLTVLNGHSVLLRNDGRGAGRSVKLVLRRKDGKTEAAGAVVMADVAAGGTTRTVRRDLLLGSSFGCGEDPRLQVGVGDDGELAALRVRWPWGAEQSFGALEAGGTYELVEGREAAVRLR